MPHSGWLKRLKDSALMLTIRRLCKGVGLTTFAPLCRRLTAVVEPGKANIFLRPRWDHAGLKHIGQIGRVSCITQIWSNVEDFLHGPQIGGMRIVDRAGVRKSVFVVMSEVGDDDLGDPAFTKMLKLISLIILIIFVKQRTSQLRVLAAYVGPFSDLLPASEARRRPVSRDSATGYLYPRTKPMRKTKEPGETNNEFSALTTALTYFCETTERRPPDRTK